MDNMINATKLFKESIQGIDQQDAGFRALRDADINLNRVQLQIVDGTLEWSDFSQHDIREHCSTVNISKSNSAAADVFKANTDENVIKLAIKKGVVVGINTPLTLPLDRNRPDLIKQFGSEIQIDPSKQRSVPVKVEIPYVAAVRGAVGPKGARAVVCKKEIQYNGHFSCKVIMKGKGLAGRTEQPIGDAIADLKYAQPRRQDLADLDVYWDGDENVVQFTMVGELECKWGAEHSIGMK